MIDEWVVTRGGVQKKIRMSGFFHGYKRDKNWIDNDHEKDPLRVAFASDSNARCSDQLKSLNYFGNCAHFTFYVLLLFLVIDKVLFI